MADGQTRADYTLLTRKTIFFCGLKQLSFAMLFILFWKYPVTKARHAKIRVVLEKSLVRAQSLEFAK